RKLAGRERSKPPVEEERGTGVPPREAVQHKDKSVMAGTAMPRNRRRYASRQGLQELVAPLPLPGRIRLLQYSGGSLRSPPAKVPAPFQGAQAYLKKDVGLFTESCTW